LGFDVKVRTGDDVRGLRIAFTSPVYHADDVRAMFVSMLQKTRE